MIFLGLVVGFFAFSLVGTLVYHAIPSNSGACWIPATIGFIWGAWPFFHKANVKAYNLLHPSPMRFSMNMQHAFSKVRELLSVLSYKYGDKWNVVLADTNTGRIVAELRFSDEETRMETDGRGHPHSRNIRVQRYLKLEMQLKPIESTDTVLSMDFESRIEGFNKMACDGIINGFMQELTNSLGPGQVVGQSLSEKIQAPPWWLISLTVVSLFLLFFDVHKAVWGS